MLRRMLRAFNDGDIEAIAAECDPAVELEEQSISLRRIATTLAPEPRALLPQPHGFEGFLLGLVERERRLLAVSNRDQPGASSLHFHSVSSA